MRNIRATRERGYSVTQDTYTLGLSAVSAPVRLAGQSAMGVLTLAGPTVRLTQARMQALAPGLMDVASQLAAASGSSPFFSKTCAPPAPSTAPSPAGRMPIYAP